MSTSLCLSHCRSYLFHSIGTLGWKEIGRYFPIPDFYISTLQTLKFYCQLNEETSRHICSWEWSSTRLKLKCFRDHKVRNTRKGTFHTLSFSRSEFSKFIYCLISSVNRRDSVTLSHKLVLFYVSGAGHPVSRRIQKCDLLNTRGFCDQLKWGRSKE